MLDITRSLNCSSATPSCDTSAFLTLAWITIWPLGMDNKYQPTPAEEFVARQVLERAFAGGSVEYISTWDWSGGAHDGEYRHFTYDRRNPQLGYRQSPDKVADRILKRARRGIQTMVEWGVQLQPGVRLFSDGSMRWGGADTARLLRRDAPPLPLRRLYSDEHWDDYHDFALAVLPRIGGAGIPSFGRVAEAVGLELPNDEDGPTLLSLSPYDGLLHFSPSNGITVPFTTAELLDYTRDWMLKGAVTAITLYGEYGRRAAFVPVYQQANERTDER